MDLLGTTEWAAAFASNGGYGVDEGLKGGGVVDVCTGDDAGQQDTILVADDVVLCTRLGPDRGIRTR